jgi:hypothetical protein
MARSGRRRDDYEDEDEPRRRSSRDGDGRGNLLPWILGGAGVLGILLIVVLVVALRGHGGPVANNDNGPPPGDKKPDEGPPPVAWRYVPDAAPVKALSDAKMPLAEDPLWVMDIAFSGPATAQAAVLYQAMLPGKVHVNVDRFDLVTGRRIDTVKLASRPSGPPGSRIVQKPEMGGDSGHLLALSPDGNRAAVQAPRDNSVAVLDLNMKKLLKQWPTAPLGQCGIRRWLGFPDNDHVLTWDDGNLVLWAVADGSEKRRIKEVKGFPEMSPNRKYVAFRTARGIDVVEVASGECHGVIANEAEPFYGHMPMAFSRDGKELLVGAVSKLYHGVQVKFAFAPKDKPPDGNDFERELETGAMNICRRDLTRNAWVDKTRAALGPGTARFVEGGFIAQGWCLYRAGALLPFCRYLPEPPLVVAQGTPDGRVWVVEPSSDGKGRVFYGRSAINAGAQAIARKLETGNVKPAIPPGSNVRVVVNATSDGLKRDLEMMAGASLKNSGLKPAAAGELTLTIQAKEVVSGKFMAYVSPGVGSENAAHRTIECSATLTDGAGRTVFYSEAVANPPRNLTFQRGQASKAVEAEVHSMACSWAGRLSIPPTKHFVNGELVDLPLTVPFTDKAPAPKGKK